MITVEIQSLNGFVFYSDSFIEQATPASGEILLGLRMNHLFLIMKTFTIRFVSISKLYRVQDIAEELGYKSARIPYSDLRIECEDWQTLMTILDLANIDIFKDIVV